MSECKKQYYKDNSERVCSASSSYYYANKDYTIRKKVMYNRTRMMNDNDFAERTRFRKLIKRFRTVGATNDEINDHRLVSRETYLLWLSYQQCNDDIDDNYVIDHRWPQAKLNPNNPIDRLIGTNVVNFAPMLAVDNAKKGSKVVPELLINQINAANTFLAVADLSYDEKQKFRFLVETYTAYVRFKLGVE